MTVQHKSGRIETCIFDQILCGLVLVIAELGQQRFFYLTTDYSPCPPPERGPMCCGFLKSKLHLGTTNYLRLKHVLLYVPRAAVPDGVLLESVVHYMIEFPPPHF